jgi:hypothetical protein
VLNGAEPLVRQRFSLAHEFKHVSGPSPGPSGVISPPADDVAGWWWGEFQPTGRWLRTGADLGVLADIAARPL